MLKRIILVALLSAALLAHKDFIRECSAEQLLSMPREYDTLPILYQGEVIGDIMPRGTKVWFNVRNGTHAIGVFADKDLAEKIRFLGSYRQRGDTVKVFGNFNRACLEHGGDLDIHAYEVEIVEAGKPLERQPEKYKIVLTVFFVLLTVVIWLRKKRLLAFAVVSF